MNLTKGIKWSAEKSLKGVLIDLDKDKDFYNAALESIFYRLNSSDRLIEKGIDFEGF